LVKAEVEMMNVKNAVQFKTKNLTIAAPNEELCSLKSLSNEDSKTLETSTIAEDFMKYLNDKFQKDFAPNSQVQMKAYVLLPGKLPVENDTADNSSQTISNSLDNSYERISKSSTDSEVIFNTYGEALLIHIINPALDNHPL
jgi:hypothetical protein